MLYRIFEPHHTYQYTIKPATEPFICVEFPSAQFPLTVVETLVTTCSACFLEYSTVIDFKVEIGCRDDMMCCVGLRKDWEGYYCGGDTKTGVAPAWEAALSGYGEFHAAWCH